MKTSNTNERAFEDTIERWLATYGNYSNSVTDDFDAVLGLDTKQLFAFLDATQFEKLDQLAQRAYGGDTERAKSGLTARLAKELDNRGTVDVLRNGITDRGVDISVAFFKPAHGLTQELIKRYEANRVTVSRQLAYERGSNKTLDLCLLVNGIPTATAELKNPLTGQTVEHAKKQYREDRDARNTTLSNRAIVHFAIDPDSVFMTTRLEGVNTRFLPFNQGTGGAGNVGGAGNPFSNVGYRTAYIWEQLWTRDAWMDVLNRFIHNPSDGEAVFPRLHQWHAVNELEMRAKREGAGRSYLVQHSTGSGKSLTLAWLAHRLSNLHNSDDEKIFDKVIVITDRRVLDQQLQETIYGIEHVRGLVSKIDRDSVQLADALSGRQAQIVITTLQKFPFVLDHIDDVSSGRRYAVLIDEAHSSQSGTSAADLKKVLGGTENSDPEPDDEVDGEDLTNELVAGRGRKDNISFFAFTATPKARTLELFGHKTNVQGEERFVPSHVYSMRQAIEEGFILDVLAHYTTYQTYWNIEKQIAEDPEYDPQRAKVAIARYVAVHDDHLNRKAEMVVEHFRQHTARKIDGRAKAMVVTSSRLHAVRFKQALDRHIKTEDIEKLNVLVAFSGTVDDGGVEFTESRMNGFPESQTAQEFEKDQHQIIVVAEKFQTGFDQPLLHTMYVDKVLTGLNAVQTLSRANRIFPGKEDTFVLDFRNDTDDIQQAFASWYEGTAAIPTDPNLLWDTHRKLMSHRVVHEQDIEPLVRALISTKDVGAHQEIHRLLDPALLRFHESASDEQHEFRDLLSRFISLYDFISQIVDFTDVKLERDYRYCRALRARLPNQGEGRIDLGSEVELTHLRISQTFEGSASLDTGEGELSAVFDGEKSGEEPEEAPLSTIVEALNERFGTDFDESDQLFLDQVQNDLQRNETVRAQALANSFDNFLLEFDGHFNRTLAGRVRSNGTMVARIRNSDEMRAVLMQQYARHIFRIHNGEEQPRL